MLTSSKPAKIKAGAMCVRKNGTKFELLADTLCEILPGPNPGRAYRVQISVPDLYSGTRKLEQITVDKSAIFNR